MRAMRVEMAFFDRDTLLARAVVLVHQTEEICDIKAERGDRFEVTHQFEEPASRLFIKYYSPEDDQTWRAALRMGVHNSDDWEKIELSDPYELCFKCAIVDSENPDWDKQEPITAE